MIFTVLVKENEISGAMNQRAALLEARDKGALSRAADSLHDNESVFHSITPFVTRLWDPIRRRLGRVLPHNDYATR